MSLIAWCVACLTNPGKVEVELNSFEVSKKEKEKKLDYSTLEFSIIAELYEGWHSFCVHYQETTLGSHVDFAWTKIAAAVDWPRTRTLPLSAIWGRWGGITKLGFAEKTQTRSAE